MRYTLPAALLGLLLAGCTPGDENGNAATEPVVPENAHDVSPLLPGETVSAFELPAAGGDTFRFDPDNRDRPLAVIFYRGGWCPFCNAHLAQLRGAEKELKDIGYEVVFISVDKPEVLADSLDADVDYTLLSDHTTKVTRQFGLAFRLDPETVRRYKRHDIDLEAASGHDHHILPVPAVYLIDTEGVVRFMYANPDYKVRLRPELLLAAARIEQQGEKLKPMN